MTDPDQLLHTGLNALQLGLILVLFGTLLYLRRFNGLASPVQAIFHRWLRWLIFSFGGAFIGLDTGWIDRPFWVLVLAFFLCWLLVETLYNWLAIHALSVSPVPLFPRFAANPSDEAWPTHARLIKVRDWLRQQGFKQVQALRADVGGGLYLRVSIYQDASATMRLQVMFLPQPGGAITVCYGLATNTAEGFRYVTDNLYLPFGGFYPEHWLVERSPLRRSLPRLIARHRARLARAGGTAVPWIIDPLNDFNAQQAELEQVNTELGFLFPRAQREEYGKITQAGRYRIWKEYWLLSYFGRSVRYQ